ncbi:redoxin domain-containing protein [Kriegella aquimaris]|uniref:Peroxiredoxin n=1 Tax=Kriegella aquimaris TaxID=192904 RepID=A0A1G9PS55_9FLAO|nr:redoxin domain-containing protein [Kriegella aquimaris]SDM01503.1 Peroxiredoxin [Kriegella aquimaris]
MNTLRLYFLVITLCTFNFSCKQQKEKTKAVEALQKEETAFFKASPQEVPEQTVVTLKVGAQAPKFNLPGTDGKFHKLSDFNKSNVLIIIFTCNHCPTAQAYEERMITLTEDYKDKGVQVVAISPNSINGILLNELGYSDLGDSFEDMIVRAKDKGYNFPYLYDGDTHEASLKYGPVATPHAFVFNNERILTYVGRLDGSEKPGTGNADDIRAAIEATLKGEPVTLNTTKTFGCSVKWAWKNQYAKKINKEWQEKTVTLNEIDVNGLKELIKNDSDKLRLINIWATWCGPCVLEYPEFIDIHRMFELRDFEFVSVSADHLESKDKALAFLQKKSSALDNYIFSEKDKYALIEAVDPEWNGALPYTALIEPGGKIVFRKMGPIDPFELKQTIVEHPMIGRYY